MRLFGLIASMFALIIISQGCGKQVNPDTRPRDPGDTLTTFRYVLDGNQVTINGPNGNYLLKGATINYFNSSYSTSYTLVAYFNYTQNSAFYVKFPAGDFALNKSINFGSSTDHFGYILSSPGSSSGKLGWEDREHDLTIKLERITDNWVDGSFYGTVAINNKRVKIEEGHFRNVKILK